MVRELFVRNGNYTYPVPNVQPNLLDSVDAKGFEDNSQTKSSSEIAKKKALKIAKQKEKEGWKDVTIRGIYSYGYEFPYRYDIESWGGFKEKYNREKHSGFGKPNWGEE